MASIRSGPDLSLILDTGALIAVDRGDRRVAALLRVAHRERVPIRTSSLVIAQAWRDGSRQVHLARILRGVDAVPVDEATGRRLGELLGRNSSADVVDAHVVHIAEHGDTILTSDPDDIHRLVVTRGISANVVQ